MLKYAQLILSKHVWVGVGMGVRGGWMGEGRGVEKNKSGAETRGVKINDMKTISDSPWNSFTQNNSLDFTPRCASEASLYSPHTTNSSCFIFTHFTYKTQNLGIIISFFFQVHIHIINLTPKLRIIPLITPASLWEGRTYREGRLGMDTRKEI